MEFSRHAGVGSLSLLQGIFPTQGLKLGLLHCRYLPAEPQEKLKKTGVGSLFLLQWIFPPRNQAGASCSAGRFFTNSDIKEAHICVCVCLCIHILIYILLYIFMLFENYLPFIEATSFLQRNSVLRVYGNPFFSPSLFKILWYILENILFSTEAPWLIRCPFYLICLYNPKAPFAYFLLWKKKTLCLLNYLPVSSRHCSILKGKAEVLHLRSSLLQSQMLETWQILVC